MQDDRMVHPEIGPKSASVFARAQVVFFEVDGVFTDGKAWQDSSGQWRRTFSVRDTMGVRALRKAGLRVCVLTPVLSKEICEHFENVGVDVVKDQCLDMPTASAHIMKAFGLELEHAVFVRENSAGGVELGSKHAPLYAASRAGGDGAVLEISNLILQQRASLQDGSMTRTLIRTKVGEL